jgi:acylphosphatase
MSKVNRQIHAIVHGRVQGVSFRYYTQLTAKSLGITGWVRNLPDGTVEVLGEGTANQIQKFTNFLQQGPSGARVDSLLELSENIASGEYQSFQITYISR